LSKLAEAVFINGIKNVPTGVLTWPHAASFASTAAFNGLDVNYLNVSPETVRYPGM